MAYSIRLSEQAKEDIEQVFDFIENEFFAPLTAERFLHGIYDRIQELRQNAGIYTTSSYKDVLVYGVNARHITYKGFAIIYTIHRKSVLIHRIIHGSALKE